MCWLHKWVVKNKEILPSMIEQSGNAKFNWEGTTNPSTKPCIVTYRCSECGKEKVVRV